MNDGNFTDPVTWVQFGVLGLVVLGFILGWLHPRGTVERLERENTQLRAERDAERAKADAMATVIQDRWLPLVSEFISVSKALLDQRRGRGDH